MPKKALIWFRNDLRLSDNDVLASAIKNGEEILPYFHYSHHEESWELGEASQWWLHHALEDLADQIQQLGGHLVLGDPALPTQLAITQLITEHNIEKVYWNRSYEPAHIRRDIKIKSTLKEQGIQVQSYNSTILYDPTQTFNKSGTPFKVFTPFWKSLQDQSSPPTNVDICHAKWSRIKPRIRLNDYNLLPKISWDKQFYTSWNPSRKGALERIEQFLPNKATTYLDLRDRPDLDNTTQLSPYLHFGQIGPRELISSLRTNSHPLVESGIVRQLYWREFAHHLLYHFPTTPTQPLYEKYNNFPWQENESFLRAWQCGETGYPIVDAGMRQLWSTGWMHNRVRMIVGSVLVKHLLQPWQSGAEWFWDTLIDASLANNTLGWQWVAGSGADGAPYFRVFNPITQGQKFDQTGNYVRQWCPELKSVPLKYLHCPFNAPPLELASAGITLGKQYPHPIVEHADGRARALDAFALFKQIQENT